MKPEEDRIAEVAEEAARKAGELLESHRGGPLKVDESAEHDYKLEVDVLSERTILEVIKGAFPGHAILAEESGTAGGGGDEAGGGTDSGAGGNPGGGYQWIIDPLDGTVNFYFGIPYYCVSIACFALYFSSRVVGKNKAWRMVFCSE